MRLTLHMFLTVDGVLKAPGGPEEDPEGGFTYGGWSFPYGDENFGVAMTAGNWPKVVAEVSRLKEQPGDER